MERERERERIHTHTYTHNQLLAHPKLFLFWCPYLVDAFRIRTVCLLGNPALHIWEK